MLCFGSCIALCSTLSCYAESADERGSNVVSHYIAYSTNPTTMYATSEHLLLTLATFLSQENAIRIGLFLLLISLLISHRRNTGLPSFIVSGLCVTLTSTWFALRVAINGHRNDEWYCALPILGLVFGTWATTLDYVLPLDGARALRRHLGVVGGLLVMLGVTAGVMIAGKEGWETIVRDFEDEEWALRFANVGWQDWNLAFAAIGFAAVHWLCALGIYKERSEILAAETQPGDKSVQLV